MFGFIKNLFGGILAFFANLFSSKKSQNNQPAAAKAGKKSGYFLELDEAESPKSEASVPSVAEKAEPVEVAPTAQPTKVEPVAKIQASPPAPVAATNNKAPSQSARNFSTDYLIAPSSTNGRRRPGVNMNSFLDMASQVKKKA